MLGGVGGQQDHDSSIHATAAHTADDSAEYQGIHVRSCTADGGTRLEENDAEYVDPFGIHLGVYLAPIVK